VIRGFCGKSSIVPAEYLVLLVTQTLFALFYLDVLKCALSELASLQKIGYWKHFEFWNTDLHCSFGKRHKTFMSCEAELQCLPKLAVFPNVSGMDGSPD